MAKLAPLAQFAPDGVARPGVLAQLFMSAPRASMPTTTVAELAASSRPPIRLHVSRRSRRLAGVARRSSSGPSENPATPAPSHDLAIKIVLAVALLGCSWVTGWIVHFAAVAAGAP